MHCRSPSSRGRAVESGRQQRIFTRGLAQEIAGQGIRVNAVRPGFIETDMHASGGEPGRVERLAASIPMKRGGMAWEVAEAIWWLLSPASSYCTGTFIDVSGSR